MNLLTLLDLALDVARRVSLQTATRVDDELLDLLEAIRDDPTLRTWIGGKLLQPPGALAIETQPSSPVAAALAARRIDWTKLLSYLPQIIEILQLVRALAGRGNLVQSH
ncbi:MAG: hypothetical protein KY475_19350 [Planctomycetes bacterium]|nr:hypothetical protein [Planctomycetota bacterium]